MGELNLAHLSWMLPIIALIVNVARPANHAVTDPTSQGHALGAGCVTFACYVAGLILGVVALRVRNVQDRDLKLPANVKYPAIAGVVLNSLLLLAMLGAVIMSMMDSRSPT